MRRWVGAAVVAVLLALAIFGVLTVLRPSALPGGGAHVDGHLLVSAAPGISRGGMDSIVEGEISYDDGCLRVDSRPVVWPHGTEWDDDADEVVLPNGQRAGAGDTVKGGGGVLRLSFVTDDPHHYGDYGDEGEQLLTHCVGSSDQVAFFNEGSEVELVE